MVGGNPQKFDRNQVKRVLLIEREQPKPDGLWPQGKGRSRSRAPPTITNGSYAARFFFLFLPFALPPLRAVPLTLLPRSGLSSSVLSPLTRLPAPSRSRPPFRFGFCGSVRPPPARGCRNVQFTALHLLVQLSIFFTALMRVGLAIRAPGVGLDLRLLPALLARLLVLMHVERMRSRILALGLAGARSVMNSRSERSAACSSSSAPECARS